MAKQKINQIVNIVATSTGATSETSLSLTVNGETGKSYYTIPQGWKLRIFEIDITTGGSTTVRLRYGIDTTTLSNNPEYKIFDVSAQLFRSYRFPLILEATDQDRYLFISIIQPSAANVRINLHGELVPLEE